MYLLFFGDKYYPNGGWNDFRGSFSSVELALKSIADAGDVDWWQIVDFRSMEIVMEEVY